MTISQRSVRARRSPAFIGQVYDASHFNEEIDFVNANPQATQLTTITVSASANDTDYQFEVNGVPVKYTSLSSGNTTTTIAAALAEAVNANPLIRGQVKASSDAAVITLESTYPGTSFAATEDDSRLGSPSTTREAAEAAAIAFGRLCIRAGASGVSPYGNRLGRLASKTGLTARVVTLTASAIAATIPTHLTIEVEGVAYHMTHVGTGGGDTAAELATAVRTLINGKAGLTDLVTATGATDKVIITSDLAGVQFRVTSLGTSLAAAVTTEGDDINELALGVSLRAYDEEVSAYPGNTGVAAIKRGGVWVEAAASVTDGGKVYVHLDGADSGKLYGVGGANRALVKNARWFKDRSSEGVAVVDVNF